MTLFQTRLQLLISFWGENVSWKGLELISQRLLLKSPLFPPTPPKKNGGGESRSKIESVTFVSDASSAPSSAQGKQWPLRAERLGAAQGLSWERAQGENHQCHTSKEERM